MFLLVFICMQVEREQAKQVNIVLLQKIYFTIYNL